MGRCPRCRNLIAPPVLTRQADSGSRLDPVLARIFEDAFLARGLAWVLPGRVIPLVFAYGMATSSLLLIHKLWILGLELYTGPGLWGVFLKALLFLVGLPFVALAALALLVNARELMMMALSRKKGQAQLTGLVPLTKARFYPLSLRGRRAFAVHATFRTDKLNPNSRVGLHVNLFSEDGKPLPGNLPKYQAPDGEFLARELSAPIGQADDFEHTLGALMPVVAIGIPPVPDVNISLKAEIHLTLEGQIQASQTLVTQFRTRASDFPAPPKPRHEAPAVAAEAKDIEFVSGTVSSGGHCPVCGDSLHGAVLSCDTCTVPHHEECWKFAGRCSTYGCDGNATETLELSEASPSP